MPEDYLLADRGWTVFGSYVGGWGIVVVKGLSSYDGMCRPLGFNEFGFVNDVFAGTISPMPMDSRTDGVGDVIALNQDHLIAQFQRYKPTDPLCCPSAQTSVTYTVTQTPQGPVLTPQS